MWCWRRREEGTEPFGAGETRGREYLASVLGTKRGFSSRAESVHKHRVISPALERSIFKMTEWSSILFKGCSMNLRLWLGHKYQ